MTKKITDDKVGQFIGKLANEYRSDAERDFRITRNQMLFAEKELINSLDAKQTELYYDFYKKEKLFIKSQMRFTKKCFK